MSDSKDKPTAIVSKAGNVAATRKLLKATDQAAGIVSSDDDPQEDRTWKAEPDKQPDQTGQQTDGKPDKLELGNVTTPDVDGDAGDDPDHSRTREVDILAVSKRLQARDDWPAIEQRRNELMKLGRKQFPDKRDRQQWTYSQLDEQYPEPDPPKLGEIGHHVQFENVKPAPDKELQNSGVRGLQDIPPGWGELPGNASLQAEIGWVQAERLRIVDEQASGATVVHLDRARAPAPSMAALGWLETSIRSYAKYVDVAAKATSTQADEAELVRRERVSIDEMRSLLGEMIGDEVCPACGRPV